MTSTPESSRGDSESRITELEEQVQRWRQAAVKTWSKSVATGHNEASVEAEAASQIAELKANLKELQAANGALRAQVRELRRQQFVRRAARALARRLR
ncbi:MAG TPA: hypothetical protein VK948_08445 [Aeromicrobium sp.]|nr:hypothetical protein [Aeromicrobium sp.]